MSDVKLTDEQYKQAQDFIVTCQRYRFPIDRGHVEAIADILKPAAPRPADPTKVLLAEALRVAQQMASFYMWDANLEYVKRGDYKRHMMQVRAALAAYDAEQKEAL